MSFVQHQFILPDGSNYVSIFLPEIITSNYSFELKNYLEQSLIEQIRFVAYSAEQLDMLKNLNLSHYKIEPWNTTFFSLASKQIPQLIQNQTELNLSHFDEYFDCNIVDAHSPLHINLVLQFMKGSFASKFVKNEQQLTTLVNIPEKSERIDLVFNQSLLQKNQSTFLVTQKKTGVPIASFTLVQIPARKEIQLHSVAGISTVLTEKIPNKLAIIIMAVLVEINNNYKEHTLTFSCSKPAILEKYIQLGLPVSSSLFGVKCNK